MATTATATTTSSSDPFNLTPPDPVPVVSAERAAGLVPIDAEKKDRKSVV